MSKITPPPQNWREGRRLRAWELHEQGWKQKEIAQALGVTEGAVSQWFKKAKTEGTESLRHHPAPGPTPRMSDAQLAQLPSELSKGPEAFGFRGQVWTTARVAQMILQVFGIRYHPAHCSRLLRQIKYSQQKPIQKATQRDEIAIQTWQDEQWKQLKKRPKTKIGHSSL